MTRWWGWMRRYGLGVGVVTALFMVTVAGQASADPLTDLKYAIWGQSNPMLTPFIQFTDSHGVNVWQYELSVDRGNPVWSADKWFWAKWLDPAWQLYRDVVLFGIWLVHWVLDFGWMSPIAAATKEINWSVGQLMSQFGLVSLFLTIAGVVGAFYIVKGRLATGVWEMVLACVVVAGLSTFLANPAGLVLNEHGGALYGARDASLQFVAALSDHPDAGGEAQVDLITDSMIETFIRQPLQVVNFGAVLDGGPCEATYDEVLKSGPHAWGSEIRDAVNGCNSKLGDYAGNPSPPMLTSMLVMYPGSFAVLGLAVFIAGAVLKAGVQICYLAVKATVTTIVGVLPGAARRPLWGTIADLIVACGVFVFSYVWLALFLHLIRTVLGGTDMPATQKLLVVDVLLVVGLVLYLTNKKRIEQSTWKLRELLASRPGGGVGAGSPPPKLNTAMAIGAAASVANLAKGLTRRQPAWKPGWGQRTQGSHMPAASGPFGAAMAGFPGGGFNPPRPWPPGPPGPPGPPPGLLPGGGGGLRALGPGMAAMGAKVVLGHLSGGTSLLASAAIDAGVNRVLKPRPQLVGGPAGVNPAVRSLGSPGRAGTARQLPTGRLPGPGSPSGSGRQQLPTGRRPLELTPGPASRPGSSLGGSPRLSTDPTQAAGPVAPRKPVVNPRAAAPGRLPAGAGQQVPGVQVRRPAQRPQGPAAR